MERSMCPSCHSNTFTAWGRLSLAPMRAGICKNCGAVVRPKLIPFIVHLLVAQTLSVIFGVAAVLALPSANISVAFWLYPLVFIAGALIPLPLFIKTNSYFVPLEVKNA